MALFNTAEIKTFTEPATGEAAALRVDVDPSSVRVVFGEKTAKIRDVIGDILPGETIVFTTKARWSIHEMLAYCLLQTGPAEVTVCTWSISEEAARTLVDLRNAGAISELHLLFDKKVIIRNPAPLQLCQANFPNLGLKECHAKVTVISTPQFDITIVGSANYNKNRRIETGVIFTCKPPADFYKQWIQEEIKNPEK